MGKNIKCFSNDGRNKIATGNINQPMIVKVFFSSDLRENIIASAILFSTLVQMLMKEAENNEHHVIRKWYEYMIVCLGLHFAIFNWSILLKRCYPVGLLFAVLN